MARLLSDMATNPEFDGWYRDSDYLPVGEVCTGLSHFTNMFTAPNGAAANHVFHGRYYLLQSLWINKNGGFCADQYDSQPFPLAQPSASATPAPLPRNDMFRK